jgi:hypothetical protein
MKKIFLWGLFILLIGVSFVSASETSELTFDGTTYNTEMTFIDADSIRLVVGSEQGSIDNLQSSKPYSVTEIGGLNFILRDINYQAFVGGTHEAIIWTGVEVDISNGEEKTLTIDGIDYVMSILVSSFDKVHLQINGESDNIDGTQDSPFYLENYAIGNANIGGLDIITRDISYQAYAGGEQKATLLIGKDITLSLEEEVVELVCDSDNLDLCLDEITCTDVYGFWDGSECDSAPTSCTAEIIVYAYYENTKECEELNIGCNEPGNFEYLTKEECEESNKGDEDGKPGLGQIIRNRIKAGVYTSPTGKLIRIRELAQNRFLLQFDNGEIEAETELEIEEETENNRTRLKIKLSNGKTVEIKIMPGVASGKALERLRLKVCSEENKCKLELKEVGNKLAYEVQLQRNSKVLAIFKAKMLVKAQVDAETGEVIKVKKPWWAFLATEPDETEEA